MQKEGRKERHMEIKGLGTLGALDIYITDAHHVRCSRNREISSLSGAYSQKSDKIETKMHSRDTEYEGRGQGGERANPTGTRGPRRAPPPSLSPTPNRLTPNHNSQLSPSHKGSKEN